MSKTIQHFNTRQHMKNNLFEVYWYQDSYEKDVALHHHDFYEIYFLVNGNVKYIIENRNYQLVPGDILFISPLELHQPIITEQNIYERIVIWINKQFLDQFSDKLTEISHCFNHLQPDHSNLLRLSPSARQSIQQLIENLNFEYNGKEYGSDVIAMGYLMQLMVELNRFTLLPQERYEEEDKSTAVISEILAYINEHYNENLSLDLIADKFFISKYHLSHEFKRLVGTSFYRYIIQKRLVIAKQLLNDDMSPTDVYQQCGFGDYTNFYRAFKSTYDISPKEYVSMINKSNFSKYTN